MKRAQFVLLIVLLQHASSGGNKLIEEAVAKRSRTRGQEEVGSSIFGDPRCPEGILANEGDESFCCASTCGSCGGFGCKRREGGKKQCCITWIRKSGNICDEPGETGCIVVGEEAKQNAQFSGQECNMILDNTRTSECDWQGVDRADRSSLGGNGYSLQECLSACQTSGPLCNFAALSSLGVCHMFRTCDGDNGDVGGNWQFYMKSCGDDDSCPAEAPLSFDVPCSQDDLECNYGEECCCGECHPSVRSVCRGGTWASLYTDACIGVSRFGCPKDMEESIGSMKTKIDDGMTFSSSLQLDMPEENDVGVLTSAFAIVGGFSLVYFSIRACKNYTSLQEYDEIVDGEDA